MMTPATALHLVLLFASTSLLSIGGGNSVLPEIQLRAVATYHWLTDAQFADLFAIAQAAPGPSILIVTLVGFQAAGVAGALLATAAMVAPAGAVTYVFARFWHRAGAMPWRTAVEKGLAPIGIGLIAASGVVVAISADHGPPQYALTAAATLVFCLSRINPLFVVATAGFLGWLGLV